MVRGFGQADREKLVEERCTNNQMWYTYAPIFQHKCNYYAFPRYASDE